MTGSAIVDLGPRWVLSNSVSSEILTGVSPALANVERWSPADFAGHAAIALVAGSGAGKTTELRSLFEGDPSGVWLEAAEIDTRETARRLFGDVENGSVIYIDGLDESPCPGRSLLAEVQAIGDVGFKVRLSCRPTWWSIHQSGSLSDLVVLTADSIEGDGRTRLLETLVEDVAAFEEFLQVNHAEWAFSNPRMLLHMAIQFQADGEVRDLRLIFSTWVKQALTDASGPSNDANVSGLYGSLCGLAAVTLFEQKPTLVRRPTSSDSELNLLSLEQPFVHLEHRNSDWDLILSSGHFRPSQIMPDTLRFVDKSTVEFLAAEFICGRIRDARAPVEVFRELFVTGLSGEPRLIPSLRRVAGWLIYNEPWLWEAVPVADYDIVLEFGGHAVDRRLADGVIDVLLGGSLPNQAYRYSRAAISNILRCGTNAVERLSQALETLDSGSNDSPWWVVEIAGMSGLANELAGELLKLAEGPDQVLRYWAIKALAGLSEPPLPFFQELSQTHASNEEAQRLLGIALRVLWPDHLTLGEVLPLLQPIAGFNFLEYRHFLTLDLADGVSDREVGQLIGHLERANLDRSGVGTFSVRAIKRAEKLLMADLAQDVRSELIQVLVEVTIERNLWATSSRISSVIPADALTDEELDGVLRVVDTAGVSEFSRRRLGNVCLQIVNESSSDAAMTLRSMFAEPAEGSPIWFAQQMLNQPSSSEDLAGEAPSVDSGREFEEFEVLDPLLSDTDDPERWFHVLAVLGRDRFVSEVFPLFSDLVSNGVVQPAVATAAAQDFVSLNFTDGEERFWTSDDGHVSNFGLGAVIALMWLRQAGGDPVVRQHLAWAAIRAVPHLESSAEWRNLVAHLHRDDSYLSMLLSHVDHVQSCPNESRAALGLLATNLSRDKQAKLLDHVGAVLGPLKFELLVELVNVVPETLLEAHLVRAVQDAPEEDSVFGPLTEHLRTFKGELAEPILQEVLRVSGVHSDSLLADVAIGWERPGEPDAVLRANDELLVLLFLELTRRFERGSHQSGIVPPEVFVDRSRHAILTELSKRGNQDALNRCAGDEPLSELLSNEQFERLINSAQPIVRSHRLAALLEPERWEATDAKDALALLVVALEKYQSSLWQKNEPAQQLRSEDAVPKPETLLSDHLVNFIRNNTDLHAAREVEYRGRRSRKRTVPFEQQAKGENPDLEVVVPLVGDKSGVAVAVEVKKCTNDDFPQSMQTQLIDRYMSHEDVHAGCYVVFCFGDSCAHESADEVRQISSELEPKSEKPACFFVVDGRLVTAKS